MLKDLLEKYPDYQSIEKTQKGIIDKYTEVLPSIIIQLWKEYGFSVFMNGYLKVINPEDYQDILAETYTPTYDNPIVMFATGMSDLIIWENNYTILLDYRNGQSKVIESDFKYFLDDLTDNEFLEEELKWQPFEKARKKLGVLQHDECYGYVPILAAGGAEKVENLQKMKIKEHIDIIGQLAGKIE